MRVIRSTPIKKIELHGFCRVSTRDDVAFVNLNGIASSCKNQNFSTNANTLPCLELCSAFLLSELIYTVHYQILSVKHSYVQIVQLR